MHVRYVAGLLGPNAIGRANLSEGKRREADSHIAKYAGYRSFAPVAFITQGILNGKFD